MKTMLLFVIGFSIGLLAFAFAFWSFDYASMTTSDRTGILMFSASVGVALAAFFDQKGM